MTSRGSLPHNSPLYRIVQHQLFEALASGEWQPNQAIPSEKKLCERFGVSIGTLRKAIDVLVAEHILVRQQGLGTFVANHNRPRQFFQFFNVAPHEGARTYPTVDLLSFSGVKSDRLISEKLAIPLGSDVFRIKNLLSMESQPVVVDTIVLPASLFKGLSESLGPYLLLLNPLFLATGFSRLIRGSVSAQTLGGPVSQRRSIGRWPSPTSTQGACLPFGRGSSHAEAGLSNRHQCARTSASLSEGLHRA